MAFLALLVVPMYDNLVHIDFDELLLLAFFLCSCTAQDEDVALGIATAESFKESAAMQAELAELEMVSVPSCSLAFARVDCNWICS